MKRHWIEYTEKWSPGPMSYWVHIEVGDEAWYEATEFDPPLPRAVPGRGYPRYFVECDGFTFHFASLDEIRACIEMFSRKVLPTTRDLTAQRGGTGPGAHWLSKLPANVTSWRYRECAVAYLRKALGEFERETRA